MVHQQAVKMNGSSGNPVVVMHGMANNVVQKIQQITESMGANFSYVVKPPMEVNKGKRFLSESISCTVRERSALQRAVVRSCASRLQAVRGGCLYCCERRQPRLTSPRRSALGGTARSFPNDKSSPTHWP